jgi:SNF family Na+-dependent transporter
MYYFPEQPPYFLLFTGLFMALTSGAALSGTLQLMMIKVKTENAEKSGARFYTQQLLIPFIGIAGGVCLFLTSGFEIFGFPPFLAYAVGIPVSLLTCLLVWLQLGSMLAFVERQGVKSLDLDSMR